MNAPTLFDAPPLARASDPPTAHIAAAKVKPASKELIEAIHWYMDRQSTPKTAFQIADALCGRRWAHQTVVTCVSRAALYVYDELGESPRGQACRRYLRDGDV